MAHFAKMNGNTVERVEVVSNDIAADEAAGIAFLRSLYGDATDWRQCSYNGNIRKQYPSIGYTYDSVADVFVVPQPFPSWALDDNFDWQAPVPYPLDGKNYWWHESTLSWVEIQTDGVGP